MSHNEKNAAEGLIPLRAALDDIDTQLVKLLSERWQVVKEVAIYKAANDLSTFDPARETQMLERLIGPIEDQWEAQATKRVIEQMLIQSKSLQQRVSRTTGSR